MPADYQLETALRHIAARASHLFERFDAAYVSTGTPDDEDGVTFSPLRVGQSGATVAVNVQGGSGKLDAWIDFNGDGSWNGQWDRIANSVDVSPGDNTITFYVPADAISGTVDARFRLSTSGGLSTSGPAADGEVEDYQLTISAPVAGGEFSHMPQTVSENARDVDVGDSADVWSAPYVFNIGTGELIVWNRGLVPGQQTHPGGT